MLKKYPKIIVKIIIIGVAITAIAIAYNLISGAVDHQKLVSQFKKAEGKLVVEPNSDYDRKTVEYLEKERSNNSCVSKTIGHDDAWIYAITWCVESHDGEDYESIYELLGRLAYKATDNKITSTEFMGDGGTPTAQQLFPYEIYQQYQKELESNILKTLDTAARTREASKK